MENRYTIVGLVVITISSLFIIYGVLVGSDRVVGIALSILVVGAVSTVLGTTYAEPLEEVLEHYINDLGLFSTRILEDTGIVGSHKATLCLDEKVVVFSERVIPCGSISVGVDIFDGVPYVALPTSSIFRSVSKLVGESSDIVEKLRRTFIDALNLCRELSVYRENDTVSIELNRLSEKALDMLKMPMNPVRLYMITLVAHHFGSSVEILDEATTVESYKIKVKILGEQYG